MPPDKDQSRRLAYRRLFVFPAVLIAVMAALPWLGDYLERGRWTHTPGQLIREFSTTGLILLLGFWILALIRREARYHEEHLDEFEQLTLTDPLTGLGNRRALERDLSRALHRSERLGEPIALLYLDVDNLKALNDRFGHNVGDDTMRALGAVLRSCSRSGTDAAYRVGGDEFVMTLVSERAGAELLAQRLARDFYQRSPKRSQLSLGVVVWDGKASAAALLDQADSQMYRNKLGVMARQAEATAV